ncbi:hypothetical protein G9A89_015311 [Geosiphon pyriformis]|nr:hypothetical protein G9A89_015311 [Geosiphon pyriformis]
MSQQPSSNHQNHCVRNQQNLSLENNESITIHHTIIYSDNQKIPHVGCNGTSSFNQAQYHPSGLDIYSDQQQDFNQPPSNSNQIQPSPNLGIMSYPSQTPPSKVSQEWIIQNNNHNSNFDYLAPDNQANLFQNHIPQLNQFNQFLNSQQNLNPIFFERSLNLQKAILNMEQDILNKKQDILNKERDILNKERDIFKKRQELAELK